MGELIYCSRKTAKIPFFVEGVQLNIFSMEELNYYILKETYLLDHSFMSLELCTWIDKECGYSELAGELKELVINRGKLSEFVMAILKAVSYCTREESRTILSVIRQLEEKSDFECGKIRADKLLEGNRIIVALYEYRRLLESRDAAEQSRLLLGNVWHNLATAYARLFLYEEAYNCYEKAYALNGRKESLKELLFAALSLREVKGELWPEAIQKYHLDEKSADNVRSEWELAMTGKEALEFSEELNQIGDLLPEDRAAGEKRLAVILDKWKEDYRKVCHI